MGMDGTYGMDGVGNGYDAQMFGYDDEDMGGGMDMLDDAGGAGADIDSKLMVEH